MGEATLCARVLVEELLAGGVREVVLSPGSRSAPLAYEWYAADRIGLVRLHVRFDERTAGFLALGLAKASGAPVAVLTTSGTAAANLHPAVLEAWHSHLPLILVTASRPRAVLHAGGNQTTDQEHLFGRHVRGYAAVSDASPDVAGWRFEVARLLAAATGVRSRLPGPVQLNVELSDPLVPTDTAPPPTAPERRIAPSPLGAPLQLAAGPQTVIVAGDLPLRAGQALASSAAAARVPLLAEPSSNARSGPAALATYRLLLGSALGEEIERVVLFGRPTLSRPVNRLLARTDVELVVVSPYADWPDPGRTASRVVDAVSFPTGPSGGVAQSGGAAADWWQAWQDADRVIAAELGRLLDGQPYLSGPAARGGAVDRSGPARHAHRQLLESHP